MTFEIAILLSLLVVALVLFAVERIAVEVTALLLLLALYFSGIVDEETVFEGFGSDVIVFLGSLFVVTEGLKRTGALAGVENRLVRTGERSPRLLLLVLVLGIGLLSAFLSNTATVAAMLPLVTGLCRRLEVSPSRLLMPVAFGSILGGACTLIGTSTNIVVSGLLPRYGLERLGLFELAPVGLPILVVGVVYLLTLGQWLLPDRAGKALDTYEVRSYLGEVVVPEDSPWVGESFEEATEELDGELNVLGIIGAGGEVRPASPSRTVTAGDMLLVKGERETFLQLKERADLNLAVDELWGEREGDKVQIHEVVLAPRSRIAGRSVRRQRLRSRYGLTVLAIYRRGEARRARIGDVRLRAGDVLLVQGDLSGLEWLLRDGDLILLEQTELQQRGTQALLAMALFLGMIVAGGLEWLPFSVAALAAATLMLLTACVETSDAYEAVEWRLLILVGCLMVLAAAMEDTGAASYLAGLIVSSLRDAPPVLLLGGFYLLTMGLTQPMSNQAAAIVVLPLAVGTAAELGLDPRPFAITVALSASCSFITPLEPASLLVYGPGRYRFRDYFIVGLPLTLVVMAVTLALVPILWPLTEG